MTLEPGNCFFRIEKASCLGRLPELQGGKAFFDEALHRTAVYPKKVRDFLNRKKTTHLSFFLGHAVLYPKGGVGCNTERGGPQKLPGGALAAFRSLYLPPGRPIYCRG